LTVQQLIKQRRLELGLTLKDVAKALGVAEATVSRYETKEIQNMGIDKLVPLAKVLCCSPGYLMGWEDQPNTDNNLYLSDLEKDMLNCFRKLNNVGKQKLLERANELLELGYIEKGEEQKMA